MQLDTERFGTIEINEQSALNFPVGLPGFEHLRRFVLLVFEQTRPIYWMQSMEDAHIALPVINPFEILEDYSIYIRDNETLDLGLESENDLIVLNVVVVPEDMRRMTANLAAPIVVNTKTSVARQILIDAKELSIRHPIYEDVMLKREAEHAGSDAQNG